jgi:hypothetical protein
MMHLKKKRKENNKTNKFYQLLEKLFLLIFITNKIKILHMSFKLYQKFYKTLFNIQLNFINKKLNTKVKVANFKMCYQKMFQKQWKI